jgi:hypothetical protein
MAKTQYPNNFSRGEHPDWDLVIGPWLLSDRTTNVSPVVASCFRRELQDENSERKWSE